jgi:hypothetical protein
MPNPILSKILELYVPKTQGEKEFWNLHVIKKVNNDPKTNMDSTFQATNIAVDTSRPADKKVKSDYDTLSGNEDDKVAEDFSGVLGLSEAAWVVSKPLDTISGVKEGPIVVVNMKHGQKKIGLVRRPNQLGPNKDNKKAGDYSKTFVIKHKPTGRSFTLYTAAGTPRIRAYGHDDKDLTQKLKDYLEENLSYEYDITHGVFLGEEFTPNKVYHIGKDDDRGYFIPKSKQKNGKWAGLQFDGGAAGRSAKKPTKYAYDPHPSWKETPDHEIPKHIKPYINEEFENDGDHDADDDEVSFDVPTFIKALEWAREDANKDSNLHIFAENAVKLNRCAKMEDWDKLVEGTKGADEPVDEEFYELPVFEQIELNADSGQDFDITFKNGDILTISPDKAKSILENKEINQELLSESIETFNEEAGLRLIDTHEEGNKKAKVYKNYHWGEYQVKFHTDGKHHKDADYHTDDEDDAHGTAKNWLRNSK